MSGWNHRVFRSNADAENPWFDIRETYYNKNGQPDGCMVRECCPGGETPTELAAELSRMLVACSQPVLEVVDDKIVEWKPCSR